MVDQTEIAKTARTARGRLPLPPRDQRCRAHLALLDGLSLTNPELMALLAEVPKLREQGVPAAAFKAWHTELLDLLHKIPTLALEADAEAGRRSTAVADALKALNSR